MNENYMVVSYRPFLFKQEINVFVNDNLTEKKNVSLNEVDNNIKLLKNQYDIHTIYLCGGSDSYLNGISASLKAKYSCLEDCEIKITRR